MAETRRKFDHDFREGAVRLVRETGKPIAEVARDLGINAGTLGNWVNADRRRRGDGSEALSEDELGQEVCRLIAYQQHRGVCDTHRRRSALYEVDLKEDHFIPGFASSCCTTASPVRHRVAGGRLPVRLKRRARARRARSWVPPRRSIWTARFEVVQV